jgi:hypothetical protein
MEWEEQEERRPLCGVVMVHNCSAPDAAGKAAAGNSI